MVFTDSSLIGDGTSGSPLGINYAHSGVYTVDQILKGANLITEGDGGDIRGYVGFNGFGTDGQYGMWTPDGFSLIAGYDSSGPYYYTLGETAIYDAFADQISISAGSNLFYGDVIIDGSLTLNGGIPVRVNSQTTATIISPDFSQFDMEEVTALATAVAINGHNGSPTDGQQSIIRIKDNGTARAISFNSQWRGVGLTLPTTTVPGATLYIFSRWNATDSKLDVIQVSTAYEVPLTFGTGLSRTGNTITNTITQYTDEMAQDAIGAMINSTMVYVDATPLLGVNPAHDMAWTVGQSFSANSTTVAPAKFTQLDNTLSESPMVEYVGGNQVINPNNGGVGLEGGNGLVLTGVMKVRVNGLDAVDPGIGADRPLLQTFYVEDCFAEGTLIYTPDGWEKIESLEAGRVIYSMHVDTRKLIPNKIAKMERHERGIIQAIINNVLYTNNHHTIFADGQWRKVSEVKHGMMMIDKDGNDVPIFKIERKNPVLTEDNRQVTYNLKMENQNLANYLTPVGVVHNKCPYGYHVDELGNEIYLGTYLTGLEGKENEGVDLLKLEVLTNKIYGFEWDKGETSYLKKATLLCGNPEKPDAILEQINRPTKDGWKYTVEGDYVVTRNPNGGRDSAGRICMEFPPIPESTTELWLRTEGYYINH